MKKYAFWSALALLTVSGLPALQAAEPEVWFCPLDTVVRDGPGYNGVPQFNDLFTPDAPWKKAAGHLAVFKIYPDWLEKAPEADLKRVFADLKRRGIPLGLEYGGLTPSSDRDRNQEGFGRKPLLEMARKIAANGGELKYLAMDEPFSLTLQFGPRPPVLTPQQVADNVARNVKEMWTEFPNVQVGTTDGVGTAPIESILKNYKEGWDALAKNGVKLAFIQADLYWQQPGVFDALRKLRDLARQEGLKFDIIYDGDPWNKTDQEWLDTAREHMEAAEAAVGQPDAAMFQTWHPHPVKLLPETDSDAFTHLINLYFRTRTVLTVSIKGRIVQGRLLTDKGRPVPDAPVVLNRITPSQDGVMSTFTGTGIVPEGTESVCFGIRANDTGWPGTKNMKLKELKVTTQDGWSFRQDFTQGQGWPGWGGTDMGSRVIFSDGISCITPRAGSTPLEINGPHQPINAPKQTYTFTIQAQIPEAAVNTGCFGIFFLTSRTELLRQMINFENASAPLGTVTTAADGSWSLKLAEQPGAGTKIEARYAGDDKNWPAQSIVPAPAHR